MQPGLPIALFENVKEFLVRLVKDPAFLAQLQSSSPDTVQQTLQSLGYRFTKGELESATIEILDLKEQGEFHELTQEELVGAVGGLILRYPIIQPMYGVIINPPIYRHPRPRPYPRPRPGKPPIDHDPIVPIDPIVQPMYGVVIEPPIAVQPIYGVITDTLM
ncbi:MAG: Nif11 family protein [Synechococcales cyanobacterium CRU_2_2]|nr:Nif11 family protein [Synechococcales cyanobacterium CRU_2_2]